MAEKKTVFLYKYSIDFHNGHAYTTKLKTQQTIFFPAAN